MDSNCETGEGAALADEQAWVQLHDVRKEGSTRRVQRRSMRWLEKPSNKAGTTFRKLTDAQKRRLEGTAKALGSTNRDDRRPALRPRQHQSRCGRRWTGAFAA